MKTDNMTEEQRADYYKEGAEKEHATSLFCLGLCYQYGSGVEKSLSKVLKLYEKSKEIVM